MTDPPHAARTDLHRRAKRVFRGAMRLAESERAEFVFEACGDDRSLRREVTALLDHDGPLDVADAPSRAALEELVARLKSGGD